MKLCKVTYEKINKNIWDKFMSILFQELNNRSYQMYNSVRNECDDKN